ncbi:hypothetical protein CEXT_441721 [Caerostris extrusa]|uniref:Uncharacterized protein n=1 Tax=Caerostris extrusa TaxID=172846 RepID=A0AAV4U4S0_CAEEX|nr:hypothetical protein CEXT_441721 [Caerostris extrusa]
MHLTHLKSKYDPAQEIALKTVKGFGHSRLFRVNYNLTRKLSDGRNFSFHPQHKSKKKKKKKNVVVDFVLPLSKNRRVSQKIYMSAWRKDGS